MTDLFYRLPRNIIRSFSPRNFFWHISAYSLTYIIVIQGYDWSWFLLVRGETVDKFLSPAVIIGAIIPILLPLSILLLGKIRKSKNVYEGKKIMNTGWAIGQSAIIGYLISSFYKMLTGRIQPDLSNLIDDISRNFQFGFWEHGIFWGWPSSHTTIAFAMMVTLMVLYSKNKLIKYLAPLYAFYIGFGVSIGIHWFSEFIAGAIIGSVIGAVVGKCFKEKKVF